MVAELAAIIALAGKLATIWLDSIEKERNKRKNYYAANIATAGLVVFSMRLLYKSWSTIVNNIEELTNERKRTLPECDRVATELKTFSTNEDILSTIRKCHPELAALADMKDLIPKEYRIELNEQAEDEAEKKPSFASTVIQRIKRMVGLDRHFDLEREEKKAISEIIVRANMFRKNVGDMVSNESPWLEKEGDRSLSNVLALIRSGEEGKLIEAHAVTKSVRDDIHTAIVGKAEGAIGSLVGNLIKREGLPNPSWLDYHQVLEELEKSRKQKNNRGDS